MKLRFAIVVMVFAGLLLSANTNIVQAGWPAISSGYAVTTNWHGIDVPIGELVTAWAGTTDGTVHTVEFVWKDPDDNVAWTDTISVFGPITTPNVPNNVPPEIENWGNTNPGTPIWYANCTHNPSEWTETVVGDWTVKAKFRNTVEIPGQNYTSFKATSFFVIPEVSFGTIAILLSMFGALAIKKKWTLTRTTP